MSCTSMCASPPPYWAPSYSRCARLLPRPPFFSISLSCCSSPPPGWLIGCLRPSPTCIWCSTAACQVFFLCVCMCVRVRSAYVWFLAYCLAVSLWTVAQRVGARRPATPPSSGHAVVPATPFRRCLPAFAFFCFNPASPFWCARGVRRFVSARLVQPVRTPCLRFFVVFVYRSQRCLGSRARCLSVPTHVGAPLPICQCDSPSLVICARLLSSSPACPYSPVQVHDERQMKNKTR